MMKAGRFTTIVITSAITEFEGIHTARTIVTTLEKTKDSVH